MNMQKVHALASPCGMWLDLGLRIIKIKRHEIFKWPDYQLRLLIVIVITELRI